MNCLVTGGAGYIGSHTLLELIKNGYTPIVIDNFSNSTKKSLEIVKKISGIDIKFYDNSISDPSLVSILINNKISCVIHFAAYKSVPESAQKPLDYYKNNVYGLMSLLSAMEKADIKNLIFSSSAAVYGKECISPIKENDILEPINPYGRTKLVCENICRDMVLSNSGWRIILLRYFNPVGAHESGYLGEKPLNSATNLFPVIGDVVVGKRPQIEIFGDDYNSHDGSAVRDYIHVMDLAEGHVSALNWLKDHVKSSNFVEAFNLGTGKGTSVFEAINCYEIISKQKVAKKVSKRRLGDLPIVYANTNKAFLSLGWKAKRDLLAMVKDDWNYRETNK